MISNGGTDETLKWEVLKTLAIGSVNIVQIIIIISDFIK